MINRVVPIANADVSAALAGPRYYSTSQAAAALGVSRATVWRWIRAGLLPASHLGRRTTRIERDDLERLLFRIRTDGSSPRRFRGLRCLRGGASTDVRTARATATRSDCGAIGDSEHVAQFYEADAVLLHAVSEFVGRALRAGEAAIVVAIPTHRDGLAERLRADGLDVATAHAHGRYVSLDAVDTLATFMIDGAPDPERFEEVVGGIIARAAEAGRRVRIFGEMVAVLAAAGQHTAAVRLEELWNGLQRTHAFSLFCAYPMAALGGTRAAEAFGDICAEHARVIPAESYTELADPADRLRAIAVLQQKAAALEAEVAERRRVERELRRSQRELDDFVENAAIGLRRVGADGRILWANRAELDMLGYAREEYVGRHVAEFHADPPVIEDILRRLAAREDLHGYLARLRCKDGSIKHVRISSNVLWEDSRFVHTRCFTVDVTEGVRAAAEIRRLNAELEQRVRERTGQLEAANRKLREEIVERTRAEEALERERQFLSAVLENVQAGIVACDAEGSLTLFNRATREFHGLPEQPIPAGEWAEHYSLYLPDGRTPMRTEDIPLVRALQGERVRDVEMMIVPTGGPARTLLASGRAIVDAQGRKQGAVVAMHDITERKHIEAELVHHALHDSLTGLPNRALFVDRLAQALAGARRRGHVVAVLYLDIDRFKVVNDSLGHRVGDTLLIRFAERLRAFLREEDTVARLGGDEFGLVLTDLGSASDATDAAGRIVSVLGRPFSIDGREVFANASIGITLHSVREDDATPGDLLRESEIAMYRAKRTGGAQVVHFDARLQTDTRERLGLETDLRHAIERGELRVHYQPIVRLSTGRVTGVEALVRWEHPRRGLVSPSEFIPLAEETGLIVPIGAWVLREACRQARAWQAERPGDSPLTMSVNLAARQFQHPELIKDVARILHETGLDPSRLKLELTESATMQDPVAAVRALRELKALGIRLAIDDFGTGYSSLAYLRRFPIDVLKIDRSFIEGLGQDQESTAIVNTILALAKALSLMVTAEGVETAEQLAELRALGCDQGQGYYFAKPLPGHLLSGRLQTIASKAGRAPT